VVVLVGFTVRLLPVPTEVPAQLPLYHFHVAALPKVPPITDKVEDCPWHIVELVPLTDVAGAELSLTVTV
jgi:hypothetical protein